MANKKIAVFDFCETLVDIQTANAFVDFVGRQHHHSKWVFYNFIFRLLWKIRLWPLLAKIKKQRRLDKFFYLRQLKGISKEVLLVYAERFYNEILKEHCIKEIYSRLVECQNNGFEVSIISGGYDLYLKCYCKENGINYLAASTIGFNNNICTGKLDGLDCMDEQKIIACKQLFPYDKNETEIVAYSDSITDLPILKYADVGYVISHNKKQDWVEINKLKEIIWK